MEDKEPVTIKKGPHVMPEVALVNIEPVTIEPDFVTVKKMPSCNVTPEGTDIAPKNNPTNPQETVTVKIESITNPEQAPMNQELTDEEFRYIFQDMCQNYSSHTKYSITSDKTYKQELSECNRSTKSNTQIGIYKSYGINMHLRKYPYSCYICLKRYRIKENLDNHVRAHTGTQLVCDICKKEFIRKSLIINDQTNLPVREVRS